MSGTKALRPASEGSNRGKASLGALGPTTEGRGRGDAEVGGGGRASDERGCPLFSCVATLNDGAVLTPKPLERQGGQHGFAVQPRLRFP